MKAGKYLLVGFGGLLLASLFKKAIKFKSLHDKIFYKINVKINNVSFQGIKINTNIELHNPTHNEFKITKPYLVIYAQSPGEAITEIGRNTRPDNIPFVLKPKTSTKVPTITVTIPFSRTVITILGKLGLSVTNLIANKLSFSSMSPIGVKIIVKSYFDIDDIKDVVQTKEVII